MTIFLLIFFLLLLAYGFLIHYYRRSWNSLPEFSGEIVDDVKISVVIAVRNEEMNTERLVHLLNRQKYPEENYQLIFVDDHSTDNTLELLNKLLSAPNIVLQLPSEITSKKKAIEAGIHAARGELIVTTDADCSMDEYWLKSYASFYKKTGAQFIAAPVTMRGKKSLLHIFQELDFLALQAITGASVYKNFHTMCNGANLAYSRKGFYDVNGFEGIDHIPSGDDMLLMHKMSMAGKSVLYMKSREAIVSTVPEPTWMRFLHQRIRWASKAVHYKDKKIVFVLVLTYLLNACYVVLAIAILFKLKWLFFLLLFIFAKLLIEFPFVNAAALFFGQQRLMKYFPFLQPLHIFYVVVSGWLGRFGSYQWKSRHIKNKGTGNLVKQ